MSQFLGEQLTTRAKSPSYENPLGSAQVLVNVETWLKWLVCCLEKSQLALSSTLAVRVSKRIS